jgi:hypothetical protein
VYELGVALLFMLLLVASFWAGLAGQRFLREQHRSRESVDSIRVVITLLVTFAALVLGLVISSAQNRLGTLQGGLRGLSSQITELDQRLREYGPTVDPLRADLILYTKAAIADTWPEEPAPPGGYPRHLTPLVQGSFESTELGAVLNRIDMAIRHLTPEDAFHTSIAASLQNRMVDLRQRRRELIENGPPSLSWPFMTILMFWLVVIFAVAGLTSPRNLLVVIVASLAALSLASSIFLALSLDRPLTGSIKLSSAPLRDALLHITQPPLPTGAP